MGSQYAHGWFLFIINAPYSEAYLWTCTSMCHLRYVKTQWWLHPIQSIPSYKSTLSVPPKM